MHGSWSTGAWCRFTAGVVLLTIGTWAGNASASSGYLSRPEVHAFIDGLHAEHGFERAEIERILGAARHQARVVRLIGAQQAASASTPPPVRSYPKYRSKFLADTRIESGLRFWAAHEDVLQRAETDFGVPAEVILAILGVETAFGRNTGSFPSSMHSPRSPSMACGAVTTSVARLTQFLLLTRELGADPLTIKGSYAGAMGLPQFMPSSYRRYAIDYDRDGSIDLATGVADAIGSIGRYLQAHGWTAGEIAAAAVRISSAATTLVSGLERSHTVEGLRNRGALLRAAVAGGPLLAHRTAQSGRGFDLLGGLRQLRGDHALQPLHVLCRSGARTRRRASRGAQRVGTPHTAR